MNMADTIAPKSDQLNADDLIAGPRTIIISRVVGCPSPEQPVAVHFEGDDGKPWKPCKSMRRVMVAVWGPDASQYGGRSLRLYRDPTVLWGGMEVGGIRISHMSHMDRDTTMALTATKKSRKPYTVKVLAVDAPPAPAVDKAADGVRVLVESIKAAADMPALEALTSDPAAVKQRAWLAQRRPGLAEQVNAAISNALAALMPDNLAPTVDSADDFPGDMQDGGR